MGLHHTLALESMVQRQKKDPYYLVRFLAQTAKLFIFYKRAISDRL
jgi:hypothetical protein